MAESKYWKFKKEIDKAYAKYRREKQRLGYAGAAKKLKKEERRISRKFKIKKIPIEMIDWSNSQIRIKKKRR